jgi:hypothetical protein
MQSLDRDRNRGNVPLLLRLPFFHNQVSLSLRERLKKPLVTAGRPTDRRKQKALSSFEGSIFENDEI